MPPRPSLNWIAIGTGKLRAMRCTHASPATKGDAMTSAAQEDRAKGDAMASAAKEKNQAKEDRMALPTRAVQGQEARDAAKRNNLQTDETLAPSITPRLGTSYHRLCGPKKLAAMAWAKRRWNHPKRISSHKLG